MGKSRKKRQASALPDISKIRLGKRAKNALGRTCKKNNAFMYPISAKNVKVE
jgi:hypothetical protein